MIAQGDIIVILKKRERNFHAVKWMSPLIPI